MCARAFECMSVCTNVCMYIHTYVYDPVRLRLRHLYQVEFCSFIVRYPTKGASVYCGHISSSYFFTKTYGCSLEEALLMNTHNISLGGGWVVRRCCVSYITGASN